MHYCQNIRVHHCQNIRMHHCQSVQVLHFCQHLSDRWDHSGFRELYPDHFDSDRSRSNSPPHTDHRSRDRSVLQQQQQQPPKQNKNQKMCQLCFSFFTVHHPNSSNIYKLPFVRYCCWPANSHCECACNVCSNINLFSAYRPSADVLQKVLSQCP